MDIQYVDFKEELKETKKCAHYQVENNTQMLIWMAAWGKHPDVPLEPEIPMIEYMHNWWVNELEPITASGQTDPTPFYVVASNVCGEQKNAPFAGSSCIKQLRP